MTAAQAELERRHRAPARCPRSCTEYLNTRYGIRAPRPGPLFRDDPVKTAEAVLRGHGIPLRGPPDDEFRELSALVRLYLARRSG
ncbi:hypothetical protein [Nocardiopsis sp. CNT312]|uniref:hypothetical protein n=1 Tax=Nocardiopsis sp. CNT312 TaxID=1137268 RepID=UPI00048BEF37|nr:hypothetical protein [Nocardiopsis sp. CNT312]